MPSAPTPATDDTAFRTAQLEALLAHAFEAADRAESDELSDEDRATLAAIAAMKPGDLDETPPIPAEGQAMPEDEDGTDIV